MRFLLLIATAWLLWLLQLPPRASTWLVVATGLPLLAIGSWLRAQRVGQTWRHYLGRTWDVHVVWLALLFALGVQIEDAHGVTTDGVIYFTQLRSVIFDRDLDVAREFAFLQQPPRPGHIVPIGPTPTWLPLYLIVAAGDAIGRMMGWWPAPADPIAIGLTLPYIRAALVSSFLIGAFGLLVVHRLLRREFDQVAALAATLLLLGATSLFWYLVYEPSMTHAASFGFVALFAAAVVTTDARVDSAKRLALVGAFLGLAFITRPQEAVFALLPALLIVSLPEPLAVRAKLAGRYAVWGFVGFLPFLILQLIHSYILFSREKLVLVGDQGAFLDPLNSRWSETLWSSWHGFFSWTPIAYIALIGIVLYARRRWWWAVATISIVLVMAWINGSTPDLGSGWSFGGRRFVSCLVLLAPGLAILAERALRKPLGGLVVVAAAFTAWNLLLVQQARSGMLPLDRPVTFDQITRHQADLYTRPPYFYPFAFPANAIFAWRTGLPIDRYDLLGPELAQPSIDLKLEGNAGRFLLDGWGNPTGDASGSAWWMAKSQATLLVPLRLAADAPVEMKITARARLTDTVQSAPLRVFVNEREVGQMVAEARQPSTTTLIAPRDAFANGFNRVAFVSDSFWPIAIYRVSIGSNETGSR